MFNEVEGLYMGLFSKNDDPNRVGVVYGDYKGGIPGINVEFKCKIAIYKDRIFIKIVSYNLSSEIKFSEFKSLQLESIQDIEHRITATRLLAMGPFAFAFKKKKKTTEKFCTIDYDDGSGIVNTVIIGDGAFAHSKIYEAYSTYLKENKPAVESNNTTASNNSYDELIKLKELLDLGVITQEEFDAKKKQLLNI